MMKKFFSKCFLIAAMVAAVGCISSCKDYIDEVNANINGVDAKLHQLIKEHREAIDAELTNLDNERKALEDSLNEYMKKAKELYATKTDLENKIAELKAELKCDCPPAQPSTDCDCANNAELKELQDWYKTNNKAIDKAVADINSEMSGLAALDRRIKEYEKRQTDIDSLLIRVDALEQGLAGKNYATTEQLTDSVNGLRGLIDALIECQCDTMALKTGLQEWVNGLLNIDDELSILGSVNNTLKDNIAKLDTAINLRVDTLIRTEVVEYITTVITNTEDTEFKDFLIDQLVSEIDSVTNAELAVVASNLENLYEKVETYKDLAEQYTDDAIAALKDYVVPAVGGLEALLSEVRIDLSELEDEVAELKKQVDSELARLDEITKELRGDVDNLEDAIEQRISSVNIQGAYSPVIGYFNIPMGIKSNIIAAYYGEFATGETEINFPFVYSSSMLDGEMNDLNDLKASLGYEGETIDELNDGKAGKIYLTINPTEVNLDEVEFALVNSLGENAPVELTVQPSEDKLSFGYTRAGGAALYEAVAKITDTEATDFSLNVSDYKEVFRDLKNGDDINLSLIAEALYGTFNEIADANAVSAAWTDAMGHSHTVLSNYDIAALSVQPLSFAFMKDVTVETVPGINKISQVIDNIMNRINVDISIGKIEDIDVRVERIDIDEDKFVIDLSDIEIDGVKAEITKDALTGKLYVEVDGNKEYIEVDESIEVSINEQHLTLTYNYDAMIDEIKKIEDYDNEQVGEIEKVISQANAALAQIRETEDKINNSIKDAKDNVTSLLNGYLNKLNGYLSGVINSVNAKLQPVLLVCADKDFALLSQSETRPVEVANELTLVPTTYSGELLAPAYKKYVAITAVNGSTDNLAAINAAAGEDLNKVLDGDVREITFKGESGNTYEITYSALDYAGFVVNTKYYVTVK